MTSEGHITLTGREIHTDICWEILKESGYFEDLGLDGRVTLEGIDKLKT